MWSSADNIEVIKNKQRQNPGLFMEEQINVPIDHTNIQK